MKKISLNQEKYAKVDDEDYHYLSQFSWYIDRGRKTVSTAIYNPKNKKSVVIPMHFFLKKPTSSTIILYKNNDFTDLRRTNLRRVPRGINIHHKAKLKIRETTSSYKGVWRKKIYPKSPNQKKVWVAEIKNIKNKIVIGTFYTEKEAAEAYNKKAKEIYGEYAYQNKII